MKFELTLDELNQCLDGLQLVSARGDDNEHSESAYNKINDEMHRIEEIESLNFEEDDCLSCKL